MSSATVVIGAFNWHVYLKKKKKKKKQTLRNTPIQIHRIFYHKKKNKNFQTKNSDIFLISAQNIDCGYSLEPSR